MAGLGWYPCSRLKPATRIPPQLVPFYETEAKFNNVCIYNMQVCAVLIVVMQWMSSVYAEMLIVMD